MPLHTGDFEFPDRLLAYLGEGDRDLAFKRAHHFAERMAAEYADLAPYLPIEVPSILDIGSGLAGIDVMIARRHGTRDIHLLDGTGDRSKHQHGFHANTQAWGDVARGAAFARRNLSRSVKVHPHLAPDLPVMQVPLVISLLSWGHHYPIEVYLDAVTRRLAPGGTLVIDIRYNRDGRPALEAAGFRHVALVSSGRKNRRMVFTR